MEKRICEDYHWWQKGVIYQIYPRSYQDSNGDGIGDLPGIIQRLDYLKSLNVDAVWLSPIYPSPMHDFGYDVSNYTDIHPMFGTMADFDRLLTETHQRGLKLILDLVPNHTSDEHPWFIESRSSRDNPKRDWYIWRDPAPDGGPPNNWLSLFGGPAWTFDEQTGQYYLHQFVKQQPELNYRCPDVLSAMQKVMRFWLDKGVDGFRVDVMAFMLKDDLFRDEPSNPNWDGKWPYIKLQHIYTHNLPGVHDIVQQMRAVLDEYDERMMVGEIYLSTKELVKYYGQNHDECHLPFNFQFIAGENFVPHPWNAQAVRQTVDAYEAALPDGCWPNWVLGNHDQHRVATRVGPVQARVANMLLLTLRGTPTVYYGEEIGLENVPIPPEMVQDPPAVNMPEIAHIIGRDPIRTPMQWDDSPNAGFAAKGVSTWLPVADDYAARNVAKQDDDPTSMLNFYRALTALRRAEPALNVGDYASVEAGVEDVFAYLRTAPDSDRFLVALNFGADERRLDLSKVASDAVIAVGTDMNRNDKVNLSDLALGPNEGVVLRLQKNKGEMMSNQKQIQNDAKTLLTPPERVICERIAAGDAPHSQRATVLLALDKGATQMEAGEQSGLSKGQVKYWMSKFRQQRLNIFPDDILASAQEVKVEPAIAVEEAQPIERVEEPVEVETVEAQSEEAAKEAQSAEDMVKIEKTKVKKAKKAKGAKKVKAVKEAKKAKVKEAKKAKVKAAKKEKKTKEEKATKKAKVKEAKKAKVKAAKKAKKAKKEKATKETKKGKAKKFKREKDKTDKKSKKTKKSKK